jgi:hypothetical protein
LFKKKGFVGDIFWFFIGTICPLGGILLFEFINFVDIDIIVTKEPLSEEEYLQFKEKSGEKVLHKFEVLVGLVITVTMIWQLFA